MRLVISIMVVIIWMVMIVVKVDGSDNNYCLDVANNSEGSDSNDSNDGNDACDCSDHAQ